MCDKQTSITPDKNKMLNTNHFSKIDVLHTMMNICNFIEKHTHNKQDLGRIYIYNNITKYFHFVTLLK